MTKYDYLRARLEGIKYQPPVGSIVFNSIAPFSIATVTPNDAIDLYTIAKHEIGHILGFIQGPPGVKSAFEQLSNINLTVFSGKNAIEFLNGGVHFLQSGNLEGQGPKSNLVEATTTLPIGSLSEALMVPILPRGSKLQEQGITKLDLAVLADVGYQVDGQGFTNLNLAELASTSSNPNINTGFTVAGTLGDDVIKGGAGNDFLAGGPGQDTLYGYGGKDNLYGGTGADIMYGGMGDDNYYVDSELDSVSEELDQGTDTIVINAPLGNLALFEKYKKSSDRPNIERVIDLKNKQIALSGTSTQLQVGDIIQLYDLDPVIDLGKWTTYLSDGDDKVKGYKGSDVIYGGAGNDIIFGGEGNDDLRGEDGNDILIGGGGNDILRGGISNVSGFNDFIGFDIGSTTGKPIATANQVDTYNRFVNSANRYVLSYGGVNAYSAGGDYAIIPFWNPRSDFNPAKFDRLKVASPATRAVLGIDPSTGLSAVTIVDTANNNELIAVLQGVTSLSQVPGGSGLGGSFIYDSDISIFPLVTTIAENATGSAFRIQRAGATTSPVTVNYTVNTGSDQATAGVDYNANFSGTATIAAGNTFVDIPFTLINDNMIEPDETISLTLTPSGNYSIGILSTATVTILDDEVNLSVNTTSASEDDQTLITLTATNSGSAAGIRTVDISYAGLNINSSDFIGTIPTQIVIPDGESTGSVTFTVNDDTLIEGTEFVTFTISNPSSTLSLGTTTTQAVTIFDNDGDRKLDILWRNGNEDAVAWSLNGTTVSSNLPLTRLPNFIATSTGDYNGDGKTDIFWRNQATGENEIWFMNDTNLASKGFTTRVGSTISDKSADFTWQVRGSGDFNGNGKSDILWQNVLDNSTVIWFMNSTEKSGAVTSNRQTSNYVFQAVADFNGDGKSDILWRDNLTGLNEIWFMNGSTITSRNFITRTDSTNPDTSADFPWNVQGTGDFNGDGKSDILWRNALNSQTVIWFMNDYQKTGRLTSQDQPANLAFQTIRDYNSDGKADILWRNPATGTSQVWFMNGETVASSGNLSLNVPTDFNIVNLK